MVVSNQFMNSKKELIAKEYIIIGGGGLMSTQQKVRRSMTMIKASTQVYFAFWWPDLVDNSHVSSWFENKVLERLYYTYIKYCRFFSFFQSVPLFHDGRLKSKESGPRLKPFSCEKHWKEILLLLYVHPVLLVRFRVLNL